MEGYFFLLSSFGIKRPRCRVEWKGVKRVGDEIVIRADACAAAHTVACLRGRAASFYWDGAGQLFVTLSSVPEKGTQGGKSEGILPPVDS